MKFLAFALLVSATLALAEAPKDPARGSTPPANETPAAREAREKRQKAVNESLERASKIWPDIEDPKSELWLAIKQEYDRRIAQAPLVFKDDPRWPEKIAAECAGILGLQAGETIKQRDLRLAALKKERESKDK